MQDYVEKRDNGYYLAGTRIALDSIIYAFKDGASPEDILRSFPMAGSVKRINGAITFYLANKDQMEAYLKEQDKLWKALEEKQTPLPASLAEKLRRAKEEAAPRQG